MPLVELLKRDAAAFLRIQNPPRNVLSGEVLLQLGQLLEEAKKDESVKVVVITGQGLFSTGANVEEIWDISQLGDQEKILDLLRKANAISDAIQNLGKPAVAAIERFCLGGGNEIAMACTYRIATAETIFGQPEIKLGIIPGMGGTQRLPRIVGIEKALPLLLYGEFIKADEAMRIGLVDEIAPDGKLIETVKKLATEKLEYLSQCYIYRNHFFESERPMVSISCPNGFLKGFSSHPFPEARDATVAVTLGGLLKPLKDGLKMEQEYFARIVLGKPAQKGLATFLKKVLPPDTEPKEEDDNGEGSVSLEEIRGLVREFANEKIVPKIAQMEKEHRVLPELIKEMAELGFYGIPFPEKYGGIELGLPGYCVLAEELGRIHGSTAVMVGAHVSLGLKAIYLFGTEDQKQRYLVPGIKGEKIGCYATTEPSVGSDLANIKTTAKKSGNGWVLNGAKQFISNGAIADFVIVLAQTEAGKGNKGQTMFIVDTKFKGYKTTKETEEKIGLHASCTSAFALDGVFVPDENLLSEVGQGFKIAMHVFNQSRISLGAGCLGAVRAALDETIKFTKDRTIDGEQLIFKQLTVERIGRIQSTIHLLNLLVYEAARLYETGKDIREEAATVKFVAAERAWEAIDLALQIHGGSGFIEDYPITRIWRDMRVNRIFEGTSEVQCLLLGKEVIKASF